MSNERDKRIESLPHDKRAIVKISLVRARNNDLWVRLLEIALSADANRTKEVLAQISENDQEITRLMESLIE